MQPPRKVVFYEDDGGRSPVEEALDSLDPRTGRRISDKIGLLGFLDWEALFKMEYVKKLHDAHGIYELRPPDFRLTFFVTTCRGVNEVVLLDCERRSDLRGAFWTRLIQRAERRRDDWLARNCGA